MKDDSKDPESQLPQDESPAIYSIDRVDGKPSFSRRSFLGIAAAVAGTAILTEGCSSRRSNSGHEVGQTGPAIAHNSAVTSLAVSNAGNLLASGDKDGTIKLWQLPQGVLLQYWQGHSLPISDLAFPNKKDTLWSLDSSGSLKRWHLPEGKEISDAKFIQNSHIFAVPSAAEWYAAETTSGGVEIYSQATGEKQSALKNWNDTAKALAVTSDGRFLLAGGAQGNMALWTEPIGPFVKTVKMNPAAVSALDIALNGALALSAQTNGELRIWNIPELQPGTIYQSSIGKPFCVAIRPQLDLFVAGTENPDIGLWQLAPSPGDPRLLKGHAAAVLATVITPDGSLLISGSEDKTIRLWSLPEGKFLRNLLDLANNYRQIEGTSYKGTDVYGRTVTYTLPCGSPIPPGSVCVCNCVPGALTIPRNNAQKFNSQGYCTCDLICTCNTVCTCQSVCTCQTVGGRGYYVSYWYPN